MAMDALTSLFGKKRLQKIEKGENEEHRLERFGQNKPELGNSRIPGRPERYASPKGGGAEQI